MSDGVTPSDRSPGEKPGQDWIDAMRAGDFERAWTINDRYLLQLWRSDVDKYSGPRHLQRIWRGEKLRGQNVLVRCYHGLGDTIQFVRFMPALRAVAREVTLLCQPALLPIIAHADGVDRAIPLHDGGPDAEFDTDIEIMEVPHAIRATCSQIALQGPYLSLSPGPSGFRRSGSGRLAVGLVWEVGAWDKRREIPVSELRRLGSSNLDLYSLQLGPGAAMSRDIGAQDISTADICLLGRRIAQLDLVVCVDTMIAHLAGALGLEVWVLLHADCDWRWPASGQRSIWYPMARLFRQRRPGDWAPVIEEVRTALGQRSEAATATASADLAAGGSAGSISLNAGNRR
ncbi:glycosyltransferase family protein [Bradyrhizobium sp. USDA 4451]